MVRPPGWKNPFLEGPYSPSPSTGSSFTPITPQAVEEYRQRQQRVTVGGKKPGLQPDGSWVNPFLAGRTVLGGLYTPPSNDPRQAIVNAQHRLSTMGYEVPEPSKQGDSFLSTVMKALDWIDSKTGGPIRAALQESARYRNEIRMPTETPTMTNTGGFIGALRDITTGNFTPQQGVRRAFETLAPWTGAVQWLGKAGETGYSLGEELRRSAVAAKDVFLGNREAPSGSDVLREYGVKNRAVQLIGGFALEVLTDPTTFLGLGPTDDVGKFLLRKFGRNFVNGLEATLRGKGILKEGEKLGREAIQQYVTQSRRALQEAMPGLEAQHKQVAGQVNRMLSGMFGKGAADYIRKSEGGVAGFLGDLQSRLKTEVPEHAFGGFVRKEKVDEIIDRMRSLGHTLDTATETEIRTMAVTRPTELVTMDILMDMFGDRITFKNLKTASKSFGAVSRRQMKAGLKTSAKIPEVKGVSRIGDFLDTTYKTELDAIKAIEGYAKPLEEATRIEALVHKGDLWLRFAGQDIINFTKVKSFTGEQVDRLMAASPGIRRAFDTLGNLFVPQYLKWEAAKLAKYTSPDTYGQLREMARDINEFERAGRSTLGISVNEAIHGMDVREIASTIGDDVIDSVLRSVDPNIRDILQINEVTDYDTLSSFLALGKLAGNERVMNAVPYFIESGKGADELARWNQYIVDNGLSQMELDLIREAALKGRIWTEIQKQIDLKLIAGTTDLSSIDKETLEYVNKLYGDADTYVLHLFQPSIEEQTIKLTEPLGESAELRVKTSKKHSSMKERQFKSLTVAEQAGNKTPITNYAVLLAARQSYTRKAILADRLIKDLLTLDRVVSTSKKLPKGDKVELQALMDAFEGSEWVSLGHIVGRLQGHYAHPEVVRHLKNISNVFTTNEGFHDAMRWVAKVTNIIKRLQTSSLSFTGRNILGEGFMAFIDGVRPASIEAAIRALTSQAGTITLRGRTFDVKEEMTNFGKLGGWFAGVTRGNLAATTQDIIQHEVGTATKGRFILTRANDFNDRMWRFAHYLEYRSRGYTVRDAVMQVRKFHVDYDDLTKVERHFMRNLMPFYTYMRKNLPIALRVLMEQPGIYAALGHLVDNAFEAAGNPEVSDYLKENLAIPLYRFDNGDVLVLNWSLPISDLSRLKNPFNFRSLKYGGNFFNTEALGEAFSNLNPMLTFFPQLATNTNLFTRRSIHGSGSGPADTLKFALNQFGSLGRTVSDAQLLSDLFGTTDRMTNRPEQIPVPTVESLLPIQRPISVEESNRYRYRDELQNYIAYLRRQGKIVPGVDEITPYFLEYVNSTKPSARPPGWKNPFLEGLR